VTAIVTSTIPGWSIAYGKSGSNEKMLEEGQKKVKEIYGDF
jgi:hypothetical protein